MAASDINWLGSGPACLLGKKVEKKGCFRVGEAVSLSFERRRRGGVVAKEMATREKLVELLLCRNKF